MNNEKTINSNRTLLSLMLQYRNPAQVKAILSQYKSMIDSNLLDRLEVMPQEKYDRDRMFQNVTEALTGIEKMEQLNSVLLIEANKARAPFASNVGNGM